MRLKDVKRFPIPRCLLQTYIASKSPLDTHGKQSYLTCIYYKCFNISYECFYMQFLFLKKNQELTKVTCNKLFNIPNTHVHHRYILAWHLLSPKINPKHIFTNFLNDKEGTDLVSGGEL